MEGISVGSLILIIVLAVLLFGSKRLRSLGEDVGQAVKGFRKGMKDVEEAKTDVKTESVEKKNLSDASEK